MSRKKRIKRAVTTVTRLEVQAAPKQEHEGTLDLFAWQMENHVTAGSLYLIYHTIQAGIDNTKGKHDGSYKYIILDNTTFILSPRQAGKTTAIARFIVNRRGTERVLVVSRNLTAARHFRETFHRYVETRDLDLSHYSYIEATQANVKDASWHQRLFPMRREDLPTCVMFDDGRPSDIDQRSIERMHITITGRNETGTLPFVYITTP